MLTTEGARDATRCLQGMRVLVTRPRARAGGLMRAIAERGGEPIGFPVIEIAPPRDPSATRAALAELPCCHLAVFVSATAVTHAMTLLAGEWPSRLPVAVVGAATARALERHGIRVQVRPHRRFDSETLLASPDLGASAVSGRRVAVLKGEGGRDAIESELGRRGAEVLCVELYRRVLPEASAAELVERGRRGGIDVIVITSGDAARNLFALGGDAGREWLCNADYVALSDRIAGVLEGCGVGRPVRVAGQASDAALLASLEEMVEGLRTRAKIGA